MAPRLALVLLVPAVTYFQAEISHGAFDVLFSEFAANQLKEVCGIAIRN